LIQWQEERHQPASWNRESQFFLIFPRNLANSNIGQRKKSTDGALEAGSKKGDSFIETENQLP
jgi:hypothetical protein